MTTLRSTFPLFPEPRDYSPCAACGSPTFVKAIPPRQDVAAVLGLVPLHAGCGALFVLLYDEFMDRQAAADHGLDQPDAPRQLDSGRVIGANSGSN